MRAALSKILLACFGVTIALGVVEVAFRMLDLPPLAESEWNSSRGWQLKPGARGWQRSEGHSYVVINSLGLRGPEISVEKPCGTLRIAVVGDSFTEGIHVPYEQGFCATIERELKQCAALAVRRVQVINFGVSGYGTAQELLSVREQVWRFAPDIVVLAVCTGNDLSDSSAALDTDSWLNGERCRPYFAHVRGELVQTSEFRDSLAPRLWCRWNFTLRDSAIIKVIGDPVIAAYDELSDRLATGSAPPIPGHEPGMDDAVYAPPATPQWDEAWRVAEDLITEMHCEVEAKGARFLVVTLANPIQDFPDPKYRAAYLKAVGGTDLFYPEHRLSELGARNGFPVLNLAPDLQGYADRHHAFLHGFPNTRMGEGHFNALGHRIAGELIARWLCDLIAGKPAAEAPSALCVHLNVRADRGY